MIARKCMTLFSGLLLCFAAGVVERPSPAAAAGDEVPNGLYTQTSDSSAPLITTQDGIELRLGGKHEIRINKAELYSQNNANTSFNLTLTTPFEPQPDATPYKLLAVGGVIYRQTGSGETEGKSSSVYFHISGQDRARVVAEHFGIEPRFRTHPRHQFEVSFEPVKNEFQTGEDVRVTLRITNVGDHTIAFMKGGRNRAERDNQYVFSARHKGRQVDDIGTSYHFGGLSVKRVLKPGETFEDHVDLGKWFSFEKPGFYELLGSYYMAFYSPEGSDWYTIWEDYATGECVLTVK
ncbi:MAG: hypothetical protein V3V49_07880 [Candidatus Krumholzibacteria bacterium]